MTYIVELTPAGTVDAAPNWMVDAVVALDREASLRAVGNTDLTESADELMAGFAQQQFSRKLRLVALAGEPPSDATTNACGFVEVSIDDDTWPRTDVLGAAAALLPHTENLTFVEGIELLTAPGHDDVRQVLLEALERVAREFGRDTLIGYSWHRPDAGGQQIVPRTGEGSIPRDVEALMYEDLGYELQQVERNSRLVVPVDEERLTACEARVGKDYVVERLPLPVPAADRDSVRLVLARLNVDAPTGDVEYELPVWSDERLSAWEANSCTELRRSVLVVARHCPTGEIVAFSKLNVPLAREHAVFQSGTLVMPAHRGHGLGWGVKAAGLRALTQEFPDRTYISTWNASENPWMLAINAHLGFQLWSVEGVWRKVLKAV